MNKKLMGTVGLPVGLLFVTAVLSGQKSPQCQPVMPSPGQVSCEIAMDCEGLPHVLCEGEWECATGVCLFQCDGEIPDPAGDQCWENGDCPYGLFCALPDGCATGDECVEPGGCESYPGYGACKGDVDCPKGYHCDPCGCPEGAQCFACIPNCLPNMDCSFDDDCPNGQACEVTDDCGPPPGCKPGDVCPPVCWPYGFCVEQGPPPCKKTGCSGQLCATVDIMTTCEWLPHYACFQEFGVCCNSGPDGGCAWELSDDLVQCLADSGG